MNQSRLVDLFRQNERLFVTASYILISLMLTMAVITVIQVGEYILPNWEGGYLIWVSFFLSLEALMAYRWVSKVPFLSPEWFQYRLSEWIVILVVLKAASYLNIGFDALLAELPTWSDNFFRSFFTDQYVMAVAVAYLVWLLAGFLASELGKLEGDEYLLVAEREARIGEERQSARQSIASVILIIGSGLVMLVAFMRLDWEALWGLPPPPTVGLINILVYFVLALILLSLTQLSVLRVRWTLQSVPIGRDLAVRWAIYSGIFLLFLGGLALILPTDYSVGLLDMLAVLVSLVTGLFSLLFFLLSVPFLMVLAFLSQFFSQEPQAEPPRFVPPPMPQDVAPATLVGWFDLIKSLIFWLVFAGVIIFSLRVYLAQNQELLAALRRFPVLNRLLVLLSRISLWLQGVNENISTAVSENLRKLRSRVSAPKIEASWKFVNLRRLSPRQRVVFFYLAMIRRGEEQGMARRQSDTPYEYSRSLAQQLPDAEQDVQSLTDEFVEARYSQHEIGQEDVNLVRRVWQRIKRAFRSLSRAKPEKES